MHRRTLLLGALGLGTAGCSVSDPRIQGTPQPIYTPPTPVPPAGTDHMAGLEAGVAALLAAMAGAPWAGADASGFQLLAGIHGLHEAVLTTPDPILREPGTVTPATVPAPDTREQGLAAATGALSTLHDAHAVLASQADGALAAFWASQAASAVQTRNVLTATVRTATVRTVTKAVPLREVAVLAPRTAADDLLDRYHEAVFGLDSALGRLSNGHPARGALFGVVVAAKAQRDALVARSRAASQTPVPGAAAYSVPATSTDDDTLVLVAKLLMAVTEAAAVVVASAKAGLVTAVDDLVNASVLGLPLGIGLAEYPGWPDG